MDDIEHNQALISFLGFLSSFSESEEEEEEEDEEEDDDEEDESFLVLVLGFFFLAGSPFVLTGVSLLLAAPVSALISSLSASRASEGVDLLDGAIS